MTDRNERRPGSADKTVRDIRRATRRKFSAEEKIRIVLEGLRGEETITALCRKDGINQNLYYRWFKVFLEAGKKRLAGDAVREATSDDGHRILLENYDLPGDLERAVAAFVDHYKHRRYHESLDNLTPADVYFGRGQNILEMRKEIKRRTIEQRRRNHFKAAA